MLLSGVNSMDGYLQFITVLLLFLFVLAITYVATRWIAGYQKGKSAGSNIELIETARIAPNKYLQLVRAGSRYLVIAVGKDEIHMLAELSEDELVLTREPAAGMDFGSIFEKFKKQSGKDDD